MFRKLSLGLASMALLSGSLPVSAGDATAEGLGVMSINFKDVVKPSFGVQGALQGAGTPNFAGAGVFIPFGVTNNSLWFVDAMANYDFADRHNYSSIVDTTIKGGTISTSTRVGYRWLNNDFSTLYGLSVGYDSRPTSSGYADSGVGVEDGYAFFQQVAVNAHATLGKFNLDAYGLVPFGETTQELNWNYNAGALTTWGGDIGYEVFPNLSVSVGGYYQAGDYNKCLGGNEVDGYGYRAAINYALTDSFNLEASLSHDEDFDTRYVAGFTYRFVKDQIKLNRDSVSPALRAALSSPSQRIVRLHDPAGCPPGGYAQYGGRRRR